MYMGKLSRPRHWSSARGILWTCVLLIVTLAVLSYLGGCSDDKEDPTFPQRPEPSIQTWLFDVWGSSASDVFVVGQPGIILHYNGANWQKMSSPTQEPLISVWGSSANEVYACGHHGVILRYNGSQWTTMQSGTTQDLYNVGSYQGEVYVAGNQGVLRRLSGSSWVNTGEFIVRRNPATAVIDTLERGADFASLSTITYHGIGGSNGVVLMEDFCIPVPPETTCQTFDWLARLVAAGLEFVQGGHSNDAVVTGNYLVTNGGRIFQLQEKDSQLSWLEISGLVPEQKSLNEVWGDEGDTLYIATQDGKIYRRNPVGEMTLSHDGSSILYSIWGTAPDNIYAVGIDAAVIRYNGTEWEILNVGLPTSKEIPLVELDKFGRFMF